MRHNRRAGPILIAVTAVLATIGACAAAGEAPPALPGIPDIGPPTAAPIGGPSVPVGGPAAPIGGPSVPPAPAAPAAPAGAPSTPVPAPTAAPAPSAAPSVPAPSAAPAGGPAAPTLTAEEHYARGEVLFGGTWTPIDSLFKNYLAARAELQGLQAKAATARDGVAAIQSQITAMKNESVQGEMPIRKDMAKQTGKRRELTKAAEATAPVRPKQLQAPPPPRQYAANVHSQYSSSSYSSAYDQAMQEWQRQKDIIDQTNQAAMQRYQTDYAAWKKAKDDADKELPKIEQALKDLQAKLEQNAAALAAKQAPVMEKLKAANEEAQGIARKIETLQTRIRGMADALLAAPETLRFKHGILEWEGALAPLADLQKQLNETQAEIDRVTQQMKAEGKAPEGWRHPQQERMDALAGLVARAKAAAQ